MEKCPFCKVIANEGFEGENNDFVAWGTPLNPVVEGHKIFVPMEHTEHGEKDSAWAIARVMAAAEVYGTERGGDYNLINSSGPSATQTVAHIHAHYVPRAENDGLTLPWTGQIK